MTTLQTLVITKSLAFGYKVSFIMKCLNVTLVFFFALYSIADAKPQSKLSIIHTYDFSSLSFAAWIADLFEECDADGTNGLSFDELFETQTHACMVVGEKRGLDMRGIRDGARLNRVFAILDINKDGSVTEDELRQVLKIHRNADLLTTFGF